MYGAFEDIGTIVFEASMENTNFLWERGTENFRCIVLVALFLCKAGSGLHLAEEGAVGEEPEARALGDDLELARDEHVELVPRRPLQEDHLATPPARPS